jgi:hypothetical protein
MYFSHNSIAAVAEERNSEAQKVLSSMDSSRTNAVTWMTTHGSLRLCPKAWCHVGVMRIAMNGGK